MVNGSDGSMSLVSKKYIREVYFFIRKVYSILISEKKILPFAVLLLGAIYAAAATIFYFSKSSQGSSLACLASHGGPVSISIDLG